MVDSESVKNERSHEETILFALHGSFFLEAPCGIAGNVSRWTSPNHRHSRRYLGDDDIRCSE